VAFHLAGYLALAQHCVRLAVLTAVSPLQAVELLQTYWLPFELHAASTEGPALYPLAECYQQRKGQPQSIDQLGKLIGADAHAKFSKLPRHSQASADSWWNHHRDNIGERRNRHLASKNRQQRTKHYAILQPIGAIDRFAVFAFQAAKRIRAIFSRVEARHSELVKHPAYTSRWRT